MKFTQSQHANSPKTLPVNDGLSACKSSADRLGRNVDLVQMHRSTANYAPWLEGPLLDGLADLYEQGLVKGVGLSNEGPKRLKRVYQKFGDRRVPIATLQVQYGLLSTYPVTQLGLKDVCDEQKNKTNCLQSACIGAVDRKILP